MAPNFKLSPIQFKTSGLDKICVSCLYLCFCILFLHVSFSETFSVLLCVSVIRLNQTWPDYLIVNGFECEVVRICTQNNSLEPLVYFLYNSCKWHFYSFSCSFYFAAKCSRQCCFCWQLSPLICFRMGIEKVKDLKCYLQRNLQLLVSIGFLWAHNSVFRCNNFFLFSV